MTRDKRDTPRELPRPNCYISPERLEKFKQIYRKEFGKTLSEQEVLAKAITLVNLFRAIYRPIPRAKEALYQKLKSDYQERRDLLLEALRRVGFQVAVPTGTYFILADFSNLWDGDDRSFASTLIKKCGVAALPPSVFITPNRKKVSACFASPSASVSKP